MKPDIYSKVNSFKLLYIVTKYSENMLCLHNVYDSSVAYIFAINCYTFDIVYAC